MFYFGGMTLGYLTPAPGGDRVKCGDGVAGSGRGEQREIRADKRLPILKELIDRANWFSFYW